MMNAIDSQLLLALTCVAVAAGVLVRRFARMLRNPGGGCHSGGCQSCPSQKTANADGFVSLDQLTKHDAHSN